MQAKENECRERAKGAVSRMTLEEKLSMLTGVGISTTPLARLDIPAVRLSDGPHGVNNGKADIEGGCPCYPTASALGATWNRDLVYEVGAAIAADCRKTGVEVILGPGINMKRTPMCGRNFEYFSEDPELSGELAAAYINGVQDGGVGTSLKHYACNNQELDRFNINAEVDERTLREYYLKAFGIACKKSHPTSVMCAYNKVNGIWCSENRFLLNTILRGEFGFDGMVISDWGAVHDSSRVVAAGLDLQMPHVDGIVEKIKDGLAKGYVTEAEIDEAVVNLVAFVFRIKAMKKPSVGYDRKAQHAVAYRAAAEAVTLLKNEDGLLPITGKKYRKIDVRGLGLFAEKPKIQGGGSSNVKVKDSAVDVPIEWIKKYAEEEGIELVYEPTVEPGTDLDMRVIFVGDGREHGFEQEGENIDRQQLAFCSYVNKEINDACDHCDNVLVVIQTGSAILPLKWDKNAKGIIQQWYTGEAGGKAIADILFGKVNPSGKLSESFARKERTDLEYPGDSLKTVYREGQLVGYRYYDEHEAELWYPFGHGLSYTTFAYSNLALSAGKDTVEVSFDITNTGKVAGKETAQIYVGAEAGVVSRPRKELKEFVKVFLEPGEKRHISLTLDRDKFTYYNLSLRRWVVEGGGYAVMVGASSRDIRLGGNVRLEGDDAYTVQKVKDVPWTALSE